jgi:K+-sensing histidine kinase KdpD
VRLNDLLTLLQEQSVKPTRIVGNIDDLVVCTDPRLFGGALLALLRRAELHTPQDDAITVRGYRDNGEVVMSIHDPASFLEEQALASLDDPFALSDERAFSTQPTTGLELILARHSMRRLGGTFQIESNPTFGTTVHCTVPGRQSGARWLSDAQLRQELGALGV